MYDSNCHLCRIGIFPHQEGAKYPLSGNYSAVPGVRIHFGGVFTEAGTSQPVIKSVKDIQSETLKKYAWFRAFECRLYNMRMETRRKLARDIDADCN